MRSSLKKQTQEFLRQIGLYHRLKASRLYDLYWGIADRQLVERRGKEIDFYRNTLGGSAKGNLIFDIGANQGDKTLTFLKLGAKVVAVEPDQLNQEVLRQSFHTYRLAKKPVVIVGKAVSDKVGSEVMWIDEPGSAKNTLNAKWVETLRTDTRRFGKSLDFERKREVETTTLDELIRIYGRPLYVKIDVEGYEVSVLRGLHSAVPFVSFEVNLPEFKPEALQCIDALERISPTGQYNYVADCSRGMALQQWVGREAFVEALDACKEACIEVFWKASSRGLRH